MQHRPDDRASLLVCVEMERGTHCIIEVQSPQEQMGFWGSEFEAVGMSVSDRAAASAAGRLRQQGDTISWCMASLLRK